MNPKDRLRRPALDVGHDRSAIAGRGDEEARLFLLGSGHALLLSRSDALAAAARSAADVEPER